MARQGEGAITIGGPGVVRGTRYRIACPKCKAAVTYEANGDVYRMIAARNATRRLCSCTGPHPRPVVGREVTRDVR